MTKGEWKIKTINDIATDIYIGTSVKKDQLGTGDYPAIKCGDINSKLGICFRECVSFVNQELIRS